MKIVLFVIAVVALLWLLRGTTTRRRQHRETAQSQSPQPMIACAYCGVHLPRDEALPGRGGAFCGDAHRAAFEAAQAKK
ncbi:MAG TPA: PP0621 family protein [Caldimonas sp.]|jgi:uncharacterized protein|nr:PP0621 family protein [Caldimonas sp.]